MHRVIFISLPHYYFLHSYAAPAFFLSLPPCIFLLGLSKVNAAQFNDVTALLAANLSNGTGARESTLESPNEKAFNSTTNEPVSYSTNFNCAASALRLHTLCVVWMGLIISSDGISERRTHMAIDLCMSAYKFFFIQIRKKREEKLK